MQKKYVVKGTLNAEAAAKADAKDAKPAASSAQAEKKYEPKKKDNQPAKEEKEKLHKIQLRS